MPSDKRARQRARREARMAELRRAQQRRRNIRLGAIVGGVVVLALILALATGGVFSSGGGKKAKTVTAAQPPLPAAVQAALTVRQAPAVSAACSQPAAPETAPTTTVPAAGNAVAMVNAPSTVPFPKLDGSSPRYTHFDKPPPFCIDVQKYYLATFTTDVGVFQVQLLPANAPVTVNNFVFLAGYHFYDGTVFHRVIPSFVDQGGDPTGTGTGGPGYKFADELPKTKAAYDAGALAMANSGPDTNGSQFYVVQGNGGAQLTPAYSMFGQVVSGEDVVDKINADGAASGTPTVLHHVVSVTIQTSSKPFQSAAAAPTTTAAPATTAPGAATTAPAAATTAPATTEAPTTAPATTDATTPTS